MRDMPGRKISDRPGTSVDENIGFFPSFGFLGCAFFFFFY